MHEMWNPITPNYHACMTSGIQLHQAIMHAWNVESTYTKLYIIQAIMHVWHLDSTYTKLPCMWDIY